MKIYFDNAATTQVAKEAADAVYNAMCENYGNPSSLHNMGLDAEKDVEKARAKVAAKLGCKPAELVFTSGGTESDNLAIIGGTLRNSRKRKTIICSEIEHPAVGEAFKYLETLGYNVLKIKTENSGIINLEHLESILSDDVAFVSIMHVNNETGCIQPVKEAAEIIRKKVSDAIIHSDMVQSFGKLPLENVDMASISSHKIHGPKGVGALYIKNGVKINPIVHGGGQQKGVRPGTENVPGIIGFGVAAEMLETEKTYQDLSMLNKEFKETLLSEIDNIRINGENAVPHTVNISFRGIRSEVLLHTLEANGIMVSSGSACASNKPAPSPVLTAMGLSKDDIDSAIRFSFSRYTNIDEIRYCCDVLKKEVPILRRMMR